MKTTRHSLMAKGILVLLSLLIMVFIFTYSWFSDPNQPVEASGLTMSVQNPSTDFQYAIGFSSSMTNYAYTHTDFTNTGEQDLDLTALYPHGVDKTNPKNAVNLLYDYTPTDITGDGITLIRPAMAYGNWEINKASNNYSTAEENIQYISFDLIFRTLVPNTTIRLDSGSCAMGNCETHSGDGSLTNSSVANYNANDDNKYGNFSRDAIVGAVRVAFLEYEDDDQTGTDVLSDEHFNSYDSVKLLWIPRPDIYLDNGGNDSQTVGWQLRTGLTRENSDFNLVSKSINDPNYSTYKHQYYNVFEGRESNEIVTYSGAVASVINANAPSSTDKVTFGTTADLVTLKYFDDVEDENGAPGSDGLPDDDGYYYGKVRVRIWLEGTDSESRRALAGGKFRINFHITG